MAGAAEDFETNAATVCSTSFKGGRKSHHILFFSVCQKEVGQRCCFPPPLLLRVFLRGGFLSDDGPSGRPPPCSSDVLGLGIIPPPSACLFWVDSAALIWPGFCRRRDERRPAGVGPRQRGHRCNRLSPCGVIRVLGRIVPKCRKKKICKLMNRIHPKMTQGTNR